MSSPMERSPSLSGQDLSEAVDRLPRKLDPVNWRGLWTLYLKEVRRFLNVYTQTLIAPMVTALLFLAVFALALGGAGRQVAGMDYVRFLTPGLIVMAIMQNAFANTSSSIVISKVQGNIVDLLMAPLSAIEMTLALAGGGLSRGVLVGLVTGLAMSLFTPMELVHPGYAAFHGLNAALMLALLGMIGGIWAEKFDHIAAVTNFVVTPLTFLSGTFYSIAALPDAWQSVARLNPFFYLIDGFRYGFIGRSDTDPHLGLLVVLAINLALGTIAHRMLARGYKLKA